MDAEIVILPDPDALARQAAQHFVALAREAASSRGRFSVALSGGSTPGKLYSLLAEEPYRTQIPWEKVHLFWGDERCVPPDDPGSNFSAVEKTLISQVPIPPANVHRIRGELGPERAARAYEQRLQDFFLGPHTQFDLVLLGLGEDGHTASLFPGSPALDETGRLAAAVTAEYQDRPAQRVTLTLEAINSARQILFMVTGCVKAAIVHDVVKSTDEKFPAVHVHPTAGRLTWLLDTDAALLVTGVTFERMQKIPLTAKLTDEQIQTLLPRVQVVSLLEDAVLFEQGDPATYVYYVECGLVSEVERVPVQPLPQTHEDSQGDLPVTKEVVVRHAAQGEYLGRHALVTGLPFRVSAIGEMNSVLLAIPLRYLQPFLFEHDDWRSWFFHSEIATRLRSMPLFMGLNDWDIYRLADAVELKMYEAGEPVYVKGDEAESLYVVDQGQVVELLPPPDAPREQWPRYFGPGNFFGASALRRGLKRQTKAEARLPTRLFSISGDTVAQVLADRADEVLQAQARVDLPERLRQIPLFANLTREHLHLLSGYVCLEYHRPGNIVARQGEPANSLMILVEGEAVVRLQVGKGQPRTVTYFKARPGHNPDTSEGSYFGAHALLEEEMRGATVEVTRPSVWLALYRNDFAYFMQETRMSPADLKRGSAPGLPLPFKTRRHWLVPVSQIVPLILLLFLILELITTNVLQDGLAALGIVLMAVIAAAMLYSGINWLDDTLEVTTRSVIQTERKLLFKLERMVIPLYQVQNVSTSVNTIGRRLGVGNLTVQSAGDMGQIVFMMCPSPDSVRELILKAASSGESRVDASAPSPEGELPLPYKVRRHWVVPLTQITPLVGILLAIVLVMGLGVLGGLSLPVGGFFLVLFGLVALYRFADWLNDTYEVTNQAVIHTEKQLFLSQQRYEIPLHQIQNVNIRVGVIGRYLGFGNVDIDTAAQRGQIAFTNIPHPAYVQGLIQNASAQARRGLTVQRQESIRQQIEDQLHPERLRPSIPASVMLAPEAPPEESPRRTSRLRALRGWFPRFELREDGQVIWRKHWINLLQRTGLQFVLLLLSIYLVLAFAVASATLTLGPTAVILPPVTWLGFNGGLFLIILFLSMLSALWFIYQYVDWRNDIYIVTDDEVIDVERDLFMFPFFFLYTENRRQASLANVQYVDLKIPNPIAMILNYGNVIVRTAGAEGTLDFLWVSKPRNVHAEILRRLAAFEERNREREYQERWGDMPRWFESYRDVVDQTEPPDM